jgi:cell wall-associated NlpC family hydrolase
VDIQITNNSSIPVEVEVRILIPLSEFVDKALNVPFVDMGRGFDGWDCWGLVVSFYKDMLGIDLPTGEEYSYHKEEEAKGALLEGASLWSRINPGEEQMGDVILLRPCHAGVVVERGKMLHCTEGINTTIGRYNDAIWCSRIIGIYRNARLNPNQ